MISIIRSLSKRQFTTNINKFIWNREAIESSYTPPSSWYTDPLFYNEIEMKYTFQRWIYGGRKDLLKQHGDYIAGTIGNEPYVIVNNNEGHTQQYKAFYNVCRHHAAQICDEGNGNLDKSRFVCPYHGWEYTLDGKLAKATHMKGCQNFKPKDNGLLPIKIDTLGPWLFVNTGQSETNSLFGDQLDMKQFHTILHETHYEDMVHVCHKRYHIKCNWKVFIDNYLDGGYHVPIAHKGLSSLLDMKSYKRIPSTNYFLQSCENNNNNTSNNNKGEVSNSSLNSATGRLSTGCTTALYLYHYPNLCVNRYGKWMDTNIVYPINVNECYVDFDWYIDKDLSHDTEYIKQCLMDSEKVQLEDIWLCERVQKGLRSSAYGKGGRYAPSMEGGEYMFHSLLQIDLNTAIKNTSDTNTSN
jgi:choline monooxygenase